MSTKTIKLPFFKEKRSCLGTLTSFAMSLFVAIAFTVGVRDYLGATIAVIALFLAAITFTATVLLNVLWAYKSALLFDIAIAALMIQSFAFVSKSWRLSLELTFILLVGLIFSRLTQKYGDYLEKRHMQKST